MSIHVSVGQGNSIGTTWNRFPSERESFVHRGKKEAVGLAKWFSLSILAPRRAGFGSHSSAYLQFLGLLTESQ